jgi:patatin-like phospholipase domain-containing protein 2
VDGGLTNNNPVFDDHTIKVSPFAGEADICPMDSPTSAFTANIAGTVIQLSMCNFNRMTGVVHPYDGDVLSMICHEGMKDTVRYLNNNSEYRRYLNNNSEYRRYLNNNSE